MDAEKPTRTAPPVDVVDGPGILAAAGTAEVRVRSDARFLPPVRSVDLVVSTGTEADVAVHLLVARIRFTANRSGLDLLGPDPVGLLLSRRAAAGDEWANRLIDLAGTAVDRARERFGRPERAFAHPDSLTDDATGLRATVRRENTTGDAARDLVLHAAVPSDTVTPAHLVAIFGLALRAVAAVAPEARPRHDHVLRRVADEPTPAEPRPLSDGAPGTGVSLDQVGGLSGVVAQFRDIAVSFQHPDVMARWGARRPQGILLYGPPGTGKTMLARALATEIGGDFREIRTPEILDKWLGASERNIKRVFRQARRYVRPTVMLFDEFDSIISYAGAGDDAASQAVNAVAGIFKQEMNSLIEENPNVIVVATTNFPERVDESLIRSGRFDVKLAIPKPDEAGRAEILTTMIRRLVADHEVPGFRMFAADVDPAGFAANSAGLTGADIAEVLRRVTMDKAMQEARSGTRSAPITQLDLIAGIAEVRQSPST
jgi:transitional endoplasmic reticulum ATPase